jgi:hypothetical protein
MFNNFSGKGLKYGPAGTLAPDRHDMDQVARPLRTVYF